MSLPGAAGPWRRERSVTVGPVTMALTETAGLGDRVFVLVHGIGMGRAGCRPKKDHKDSKAQNRAQ